MQASERFMAEARKYLALAQTFFQAGELELADAASAIAANKVAAAVRIAERVVA